MSHGYTTEPTPTGVRVTTASEVLVGWVDELYMNEGYCDWQIVDPRTLLIRSNQDGHVLAIPLDKVEFAVWQEPWAPSFCPVCGEVVDYCQGHGEIGDPTGWKIMRKHDSGLHVQCHPNGCEAHPAYDAGRPSDPNRR